jgi:CDP-diacylglycerol--glycerol-3-phosphate 3-phosphatidyltransferase
VSRVDHASRDSALTSLRRRVALLSLVAVTLTVAGYGLLRTFWDPLAAGRWLVPAGVVLGVELVLLSTSLDANHRHEEDRLLPEFGPGNLVTVARGVLLAWVAGFVAIAWADRALAWLPAVLYGLAAALDFADGTLARATDRVTVLGERLDLEFDALGLLVAPVVGVVAAQLPLWYVSVGLARYLFVGGLALRERRGLSTYDLPPRRSRRVMAGLQMAFVPAALSPTVALRTAELGALLVGVPVLLGFVRDWLYATGRLTET